MIRIIPKLAKVKVHSTRAVITLVFSISRKYNTLLPHVAHKPMYEFRFHKTTIWSHPSFRKYNVRLHHFAHEPMLVCGATKLDLFQ